MKVRLLMGGISFKKKSEGFNKRKKEIDMMSSKKKQWRALVLVVIAFLLGLLVCGYPLGKSVDGAEVAVCEVTVLESVRGQDIKSPARFVRKENKEEENNWEDDWQRNMMPIEKVLELEGVTVLESVEGGRFESPAVLPVVEKEEEVWRPNIMPTVMPMVMPVVNGEGQRDCLRGLLQFFGLTSN